VPASSFCEPNGDVKPASWNWFALADPEEPRPLFAFAGIWRRHQGPIKKDGPSVTLDVFSFMTTTPNELVATINHERMPVLLATPDDHEMWLNGRVEEALTLVKPFPTDGMRIVQTGCDKRNWLDGAARKLGRLHIECRSDVNRRRVCDQCELADEGR
jgi:putative SOS response-associated peptidase YedK